MFGDRDTTVDAFFRRFRRAAGRVPRSVVCGMVIPMQKRDEVTEGSDATTNGIATPMAIGGVVGGTAAYVGVPMAVNAIGFTAEGIAAGSTAAGMMSTAAMAEGGVAAGSTVATLQSIGATGSLGAMAGPVVAGGILAGLLLVAGIVLFVKWVKKPWFPAGSDLPQTKQVRKGCWFVATEEGVGNVVLYPCQEEASARELFDAAPIPLARLLLDPTLQEINHAGWNECALATIRKYISDGEDVEAVV